MMSVSISSHRKSEIHWESNVIDRLLHIVSPLILTVAAIFLIAEILNAGEPQREVVCQFPAEFTYSMRAYGLEYCRSGLATYHKPMTEEIPSHEDRLKELTLPPLPKGFQRIMNLYIRDCLLFAMLCILPYAAWSLLGKADGFGVLRITHANKAPSMTSSMGSLAWYVITRAAMALVSVIICANLSGDYTKPGAPDWSEPRPFLCGYRIRRLGRNIEKYTSSCIHSISNGNSDAKDLAWVRTVLFIWFVGLSVILALNVIFVLAVCISSFFHGFRKMVLHKMVATGQGRSNDVMISPHQAFVIIMAARNGYGQEVSEMLTSQAESLASRME